MSKQHTVIKQVPQQQKKGFLNLLFKPIGLLLDVLFYLALSVFFGIVIEWLGMFFGVFPAHHAQSVLQTELSYLGDNFTTTLFGVSAGELARQIITTLNVYLHTAPVHQGDAVMIVINWVKSLGNEVVPYINALIYVLMITAIRCVVIVLSSVSFVIVGIAAMVDGLHVRELRKVGGDDEHGDVYHWAKAAIPHIVIISPVTYLAFPGAINPNVILLPGMGLFFVAIFLFFSKYKKVL